MTAPAHPGKHAPTPTKTRLRVTTANVRSDITGDARRAEYAAAAAVSDVLCTQEDHTVKAADLMPAGWGTYQGRTGRCCVHWRESVLGKRSARTLLLNAANGLTFPAASRKAATVVLRHRATGRSVKVTSVHFVPHADDDRRPGVLTPKPRGAKAVVPSIEALVADAARFPADVQIVGGDVNVDVDGDLRIRDMGMVERLRAAGFVTDVEALGPTPDTHGAQEYDWLLVKGGRWTWHRTLPKRRSDHRAKTAVVEFR